MNIKLLSAKWGELTFTDRPVTSAENLMPGAIYKLATNPHRDYYFLFQELPVDGCLLRHCSIQSRFKETYTLLAEAMITLRFGLWQSHQFSIPYMGALTFHERAYNLLHLPQFSTQFTTRNNDQFIFLDIQLTQDYLQNLAKDHPNLLADFINKVEHKLPARLCVYNTIADITTLRWLDELIECAHSARRTVDKMNLALNRLTQRTFQQMAGQEAQKNHYPSLLAAEKVYAAARLLETSTNNYSIKDLAVITDTKPFTLKNNFKKVFGYSVMHHRAEERMRRALRLVNDDRYTRKEIAAMLHYNNASDFSRDFKRRFGYSPYRK